ncbi:MAG: hypothetical protein GFH27_549283n29 [Chloroflexi bacterium AL-W]|nr:hypothetical protein [Chloroflexi bacterium AL-N1]NOK64851.1 hypothetical protein [Chloroflexi bacterium AL-N10]NOK76621.1 hypothetical protein [Chloroflexi bacterium AL-N5]NOK80150.1 hypothetical protein [Chloroflexi bacterium AL-W]NOK86663.1 hypothetical protein [Chloroflexi bacterium AL-N15]
MTRVTRYKTSYIIVIICLIVLCLGLLYFSGWNVWVTVGLIFALLIPGRVQGLLFRDLFRGRRALDQHHPAEALEHWERFLKTIQSQPWRKPALWLSWSVYTPSVEAMVLNNIGTAHLILDNREQAIATWHAALELDPRYPLPYTNLAVVSASEGDSSTAENLLASAKQLGYSGNAFDQVVQKVQHLLANVESHGPSI